MSDVILVVGGGIAGMRAATELLSEGFKMLSLLPTEVINFVDLFVDSSDFREQCFEF